MAEMWGAQHTEIDLELFCHSWFSITELWEGPCHQVKSTSKLVGQLQERKYRPPQWREGVEGG